MDSSDDTEMDNGSGMPNGSASTVNGASSGSATAVNTSNGHETNGHRHPSPEDLAILRENNVKIKNNAIMISSLSGLKQEMLKTLNLTYARESNDYEMEECNESEDEEEIPQQFPANTSLLDANVANYLANNQRSVLEKFRHNEAMVTEMLHNRNGVGMDLINAFNAGTGVSILHQFWPPLSNVTVNQRTPSPPLAQNIPSTLESNQMAVGHINSRPPCGQSVSIPRPLSVSPQPGSSKNNGETPMTPSSRSNGESSSRESDPSPRSLVPVSNQHGAVQSGSNWSYEEQFRQVRQLYEIDDNPERKIFLDKLFSFMHQRGTPINRLPIMAKSVLDLFELYKLVIQRGGLVEVINKKLWQEIIKGLRLPASITSAAFTLRTQYMKYLYPYEQTHERLSTSCQLQQAIETNKRESRQKPNPTIMAVNYPANRENQSALGMNTLSLGLPGPINPSGSQQPRGPHMLMPNGSQHPQHLPQMPNEYMLKMLNEQRRTLPQDSQSQPIDPIVARMMWMYQQNMYPGRPPTPEPSPPTPEPPTPEPQALDLARSDSDRSSRPVSPRGEPSSSRRDRENTDQLPTTNCKRKSYSDDEDTLGNERKSKAFKTQIVTISEYRPDAVRVRIEIDATVYEGSLPLKQDESGSDTDEPSANGKQQ